MILNQCPACYSVRRFCRKCKTAHCQCSWAQCLCDFCRKPRDDKHDLLQCYECVKAIADMNNLRREMRKG